MTEVLNISAYLAAGALAPALLGLALLYRRRYRPVVMAWRKPQFAVFTILAFIVNLFLFVLGCFFMAIYLGNIKGLEIAGYPSGIMLDLGLDCFLFLSAITMVYFAIQQLYTQFVTTEGVVMDRLLPLGGAWRPAVLDWSEIKDYYLHSDYPVTYFNFLIRDSEGFTRRHTIRVPFHAKVRFESLLDSAIENYKFQKSRAQAATRNISHN